VGRKCGWEKSSERPTRITGKKDFRGNIEILEDMMEWEEGEPNGLKDDMRKRAARKRGVVGDQKGFQKDGLMAGV